MPQEKLCQKARSNLNCLIFERPHSYNLGQCKGIALLVLWPIRDFILMDKQSVLTINHWHFHWLSLSGLLGHFNTFSISKSCRVGKQICMAPAWPRGVWGGVRCVCMREQSLILIWATASVCISCPPQTASCPWRRSTYCPPSDIHTHTHPPAHTPTCTHRLSPGEPFWGITQ